MIEVTGIETNNLKNIDVVLYKEAINLILGPSGSGKSSLAFDTIGKIGQHEMISMFADEVTEPNYKVKSYSNMIAAVPISQSNKNNNIRSTIGTYFGINRSICLLYSALLGVEDSFFILNKEKNICPECKGLGFVRKLDPNLIFDYNSQIAKCPIKVWDRNRDFYSQILSLYCEDEGIDIRKNFRTLKESEKQSILYGESKKKYFVKYKHAGILSTRTTKFYGPLTEIPMLRKFSPNKKFMANMECPICNGWKYSLAHNKFKLFELSIGELMCTPFSEMNGWIHKLLDETSNSNLSFAASQISRFIKKAVELGLGHLFFNRSIPTLSGGELQRLRLVQVFNTQLSNLLIVLDEPLAGLSKNEKPVIYDDIVRLSKDHTMLIVDHSKSFLSKAKKIIVLGEGGGKNGGSIVDTNQFFDSQRIDIKYLQPRIGNIVRIDLDSPVHGFKGVNIEIVEKSLNILTGQSGVGKTTLLSCYLPRCFEKYRYIQQKALIGKKNSSVATTLGILDLIQTGYAKVHNKDRKFFSKSAGGMGACNSCGGVGFIDFGSDYRINTMIECEQCKATGYSRRLEKYQIRGKSISHVFKMTIDEAKDFYSSDKKMFTVLSNASDIMLGHLVIGQPTSTLSGGENIRIKILKSLSSTASIYGIDEPFRGLCLTEIYSVIQFLLRLVTKNNTVIVADHVEESFPFFAKRIELSNIEGKLVELS
jgi:excinuclease UvrABC ATPase subunit